MNNFGLNKIGTIIKHEYITRVRTKAFIIATLLAPILMILVIAIPVLSSLLTNESTERKIAIIDETHKLGYEIAKLNPDKYAVSNEKSDILRNEVLAEKLDGYLIIPSNIIDSGKATVFSRGGGGIGFIQSIESNLGNVVRRERLEKFGADSNVIKLVEKGVKVQTEKVTQKGTEEDFTVTFTIVGYVLGFMIYIMMFMYGSIVMRGVIEEKTNRIVEIIASSAKPFEIMMGKVIGIGAVGLTQVLAWVILSNIMLIAAGPIINSFAPHANNVMQGMNNVPNANLPAGFHIPSISPWLFVAFIFYFLSGYFIYATMFAAVGSAVDQESDAQSLTAPVTIPIILPILFISAVMQNPDGLFSTVMSLIPFFSPILMIVRIAATNVPIWQIIASIILVIATFLGCVWAAARVYRVGILMYGKKPSLKDLIKWVKIAK